MRSLKPRKIVEIGADNSSLIIRAAMRLNSSEGERSGDVVFIDSSHVLRAQNDCVFEYTELLPSLPSGVVVHVHDIFTPFDYPDGWLNKDFHLWGEQYVLEAILANSDRWSVLAPLSWLSQDAVQFKLLCPFYEVGHRLGSMWIKKR